MLLLRGTQGDHERARVLLCKALALHESMGMKWHVKRVATRIAQL
jgi:hypothetical protein